jgi:pyruvate/2-oxoglutarate dehydrogenase complex dihydrolipoamide acyltransferase (E2) component
MVAASARVGRERDIVHGLVEVEVDEALRLMKEHRGRTGERLSMTAYIVACLARAVAEQPELNSFRKGGRLLILEDVTVNVLVEREIGGEKVPEPLAIHRADTKSYRMIHEEIRAAQARPGKELGELSGMAWLLRLVPSFLLATFVRSASRSPVMARRYGKLAVTAVGMFGGGAMWFIPLSGATLAVTVGGIVERAVLVEGRAEARERLCLTLSFDHDIVDGGPAARFAKRLGGIIADASLLRETADSGAPGLSPLGSGHGIP